MERSKLLPKRMLEVEVRRTRTAIFIARGSEHRELSEVGGLIWRLSSGRRSVAEIVAHVCNDFEVDEETATRDALEFLDELAAKSFVAWVHPVAQAAV